MEKAEKLLPILNNAGPNLRAFDEEENHEMTPMQDAQFQLCREHGERISQIAERQRDALEQMGEVLANTRATRQEMPQVVERLTKVEARLAVVEDVNARFEATEKRLDTVESVLDKSRGAMWALGISATGFGVLISVIFQFAMKKLGLN